MTLAITFNNIGRHEMTLTATRSGSDPKTGPSRLRDHGVCRSGALPALTITAPAHDVIRKPAPLPHPGLTREPGQEKEKSQFYTRPDLAERFYRSFRAHFDPEDFQMVEPGAGWGAFLGLLPIGSFGCDIEPMRDGIYTADFLSLEIHSGRRVACIGNPPFGRNAKLAIRFFNRAAAYCDVIAFILPRTFRKASTINDLNDQFHLLHEEPVPANAFLFQGKPRSVPSVFQIWVRRKDRRAQLPDIKTHPDFEFTSRQYADFAIQRIGKRAGRVHDALWRSDQAHYFIKGNVRKAMESLRSAFATVAQDTAGKPSLAKSEIVSIYSELTSGGFRRT